MKIVVAFDSFKGSLTASEACAAAREGLLSVVPDAEVVSLPVADGGEGTADALVSSLVGNYAECRVAGPLGDTVTARYGLLADGTAVMDMAAASGLTLVSPERMDPLKASSCGTGEMIIDALGLGVRRIIVGLGGSATVDGGMGMLRALGVRFFDADHRLLRGSGAELERVERIDFSSMDIRLRECRIEAAADTSAPLSGPDGAACVFAPQKGADVAMTRRLDEALRHFGLLLGKATGRNVSETPGAGAAGGLGAALLAMPHSVIRPGIGIVLDAMDFDALVAGAYLVLTGEGRMDAQTLTGKAPFGVLRRCMPLGIPVAGVAGTVTDREELINAGFCDLAGITPPGVSLEEAMRPEVAKRNLSYAISSLFKNF